MAGMNQVARLSALTARRKVTGRDSGSRPGKVWRRDPLRNGRGCHVQLLRRPLEAAGTDDRCQSGQESIIQHRISFSKPESETLTFLILYAALGSVDSQRTIDMTAPLIAGFLLGLSLI